MGLLAPLPTRAEDEPKCQPGAYLQLGPHLYYVLEFERTGPNSGMAACENCRTGFIVRLSFTNIGQARLVQAAPSLLVPDRIPGGDA